MIPESTDLDQVLGGQNVFSTCPVEDRRVIRAQLERSREFLSILDLSGGGDTLSASGGLLPDGHLYGVLQGRVSLLWQTEADRRLSVLSCSEGQVFGELQCGLLGLPCTSLGLLVAPVRSRRGQPTRLLEFPAQVVSELLKNASLERRLAATTIERLRQTVAVMSLQVLHKPELTIAHLCLSPVCGVNARYHPSLHYLGGPVTVEKTVTFAEFRHLTGLATNTVRKWVGLLERAKYIRTTRDRAKGTRLTVADPSELIEALRVRALTLAA